MFILLVAGCSSQIETTNHSGQTAGTTSTAIMSMESDVPDMAAGYLLSIYCLFSAIDRTKDTRILAIDTTRVSSMTAGDKRSLLQAVSKFGLTGIDKSLREINDDGFWGFFYDGALVIFQRAGFDGKILSLDITYYGPYYMHGIGLDNIIITYGQDQWKVTSPGGMSMP
jgi:hypothetical protein